ncbi:MAG: hypothetical protein IPK60_18450 [Sandaracinaceae bacterium]|nr:hypothetical protein [Sandaracinaceae bacterium]
MSDEIPLQKRVIRARALRAAQAVAIVATLSGAGCSSRSHLPAGDGGNDSGHDSGSVADAGSDLGNIDAGLADAGGPDLGSADSSVPTEPDFGVNPCIGEAGMIDIECCSEMGFPPGCPVIGPFVPPPMDIA